MDLLKEKEWEDMKFKIDAIYDFIKEEKSSLNERNLRLTAKVNMLESGIETMNEILKSKAKEN